MRVLAIVFVLVPATAALVGADGPPPVGGAGPKDELVWLQPSPTPPVAASAPVRARLAGDVFAPVAASGELATLRPVSLREGSAIIALAGAKRPIRPGDRVGAARVKAIGSDRIILEQDPPGATSGGAVTIVVTFGPGGEPRVRTYAAMGARTPPSEVR